MLVWILIITVSVLSRLKTAVKLLHDSTTPDHRAGLSIGGTQCAHDCGHEMWHPPFLPSRPPTPILLLPILFLLSLRVSPSPSSYLPELGHGMGTSSTGLWLEVAETLHQVQALLTLHSMGTSSWSPIGPEVPTLHWVTQRKWQACTQARFPLPPVRALWRRCPCYTPARASGMSQAWRWWSGSHLVGTGGGGGAQRDEGEKRGWSWRRQQQPEMGVGVLMPP